MDRGTVTEETDAHGDLFFRHLNFSGFSFPSDGLSIGKLRRIHPELFDLGTGLGQVNHQPKYFLDPYRKGYVVDGLGEMLSVERLVAAFSYAEAKGIPYPDGVEGPEMANMIRDELVELYTQYRLASGEHQAREMIRDIERQGRNMAAETTR